MGQNTFFPTNQISVFLYKHEFDPLIFHNCRMLYALLLGFDHITFWYIITLYKGHADCFIIFILLSTDYLFRVQVLSPCTFHPH